MRKMHVLQPFEVGSKKSKSLALLIPAKVVRECNINTDTVFALRSNAGTKTITLQQTFYPIDNLHEQEIAMPTGESLHPTNQQAAEVR